MTDSIDRTQAGPPGDAPAEAAPRLRATAAFSSPAFRYLWLNSLSFALMQSTQRFAYVWLVLELGGGVAGAGLVTFAMGIPVLVVALPAGVLSDRVDRRAIMATSQLGAIAVTAATAGLLIAGLMTVPLTIVLGVALGTTMALGQPVRQAAIPSVVPQERLMNAIVLMSFVMNTSLIVGPAIGGAVIAVWGLTGAFVVATVVYVIGALFLIPLRLPNATAPGGPRPGGIGDGFAFIARHAGIRTLFVFLALSGILMMGPFTALLPEIARTQLGREAFEASLLFTALGAGMMVASLVLASIGSLSRRGMWFTLNLIPGGLIFAAIGLSRWYVVTLALMFVWGIGGGFFMNLNQTLVQSNTPNEYMGRVMSVHTLCFMGITPLGALLAGAGAEALGVDVWVGLSGVALAVVAVLVFLTQPSLRRMP